MKNLFIILLCFPCFCMGQNSENDSLSIKELFFYNTGPAISKMNGLGFSNLLIDTTTLFHIDSSGMKTGTVFQPQTKTDTVQVSALCLKVNGKDAKVFTVVHGDDKYVFPYITDINQERTLEWQTWLEPFKPDMNGHSMGMRFWENGYVVTSTRWLDPTEGCYQLLPLQNDTND